MAGGKALHVASDNWKAEVLDSNLPVLVDFWAEYCAPCKLVAPTLDELAGELAAKIKIVKVDATENPMLASQFGIRSIPTFLVFQKGKVVAQWGGALTKQGFKDKLAPFA